MRKLKRVMFIVFLASCFTVMSQSNPSTYFVNVPQIGSDASLLVLENNINLSSSDLTSFRNSSSNQNLLLINQIGTNNIVDIKKGVGDSQQVNQYGKSNYYSFIDYYNTAPTNMDILQQGNANSLQVYGTNSFMENIKITQKSSYKTIIIKNY